MRGTLLGQTPWDNPGVDQAQIAKTRRLRTGSVYDDATMEQAPVKAGRPVRFNADEANGAGPIPNAGIPDATRTVPFLDGYRPRTFKVVR